MDLYPDDDEAWMESGIDGVASFLLKCRAPEDVAHRIQFALAPAPGGDPIRSTFTFPDEFSTSDGVCGLLASLGRNTDTTIDYLQISARDLLVTVGNRTTIFRNLKVGQREIGALWVNLRLDPKIRKLTIFTELRDFGHTNVRRFTQALGSNSFLRSLNVFSSSIRGKDSWTETYGRPPRFKDVHERAMPAEALSGLMNGLKASKLESLGIMAFPEDLNSVADLVAARTTRLNSLTVIYVPAPAAGEGYAAEILTTALTLTENTSLKSFELEVLHSDPCTTATNTYEGPHNHRNCGINRLVFRSFPSHAVDKLCSLLRKNKTLQTVGLRDSHLAPKEWIKILRSLQGNNSLDHLDISFCSGLKDTAFDEIRSLLQTNGRLQIALTGTELQPGEALIIDEELRINEEYRTKRAVEATVARTTGRIVLCGRPSADPHKMRICQTLHRLQSCADNREKHIRRHPHISQFFPDVHRGTVKHLLHPNIPDVKHNLHSGRRKGPEISLIGHAPNITFIWNLLGQREMDVVYDHMFTNATNSYFAYVCSAIHLLHNIGACLVKEEKSGEEDIRIRASIRNEFEPWLRFMASKSNHRTDQHGQPQPLGVAFVITFEAALKAEQRHRFKDLATDVVKQFKDDFGELLDISDSVEFIDVDARLLKDVERCFDVFKDRLRTVLAKSPEYEVYATVRDKLRPKNPSEPILTFKQVKDICAQGALARELRYHGSRRATAPKTDDEAFEEGLKFALKYLNDAGDVIFVEELNLVIIQVARFVREVLGYLVDPFRDNGKKSKTGSIDIRRLKATPRDERTAYHDSGFVRKSRVIELLKEVLSQDMYHESFIDLMVLWEICFNGVPENEGNSSSADPHLYFPKLLGDGGDDRNVKSEALEWKLRCEGNSAICYVGRRLQYEQYSMVLRPAFFPRLQVALRNYLTENQLDTKHFAMSQNSIRFATDGIEVIVETSGSIGYFVDILAKSTGDFQKTVDFISHHVEWKIVELCTSPQGCPDVIPVKSVIRPACVKWLYSCEDRKDQAVLMSTLQKCKPGHKHTWRVPIREEHDYDFVSTLLNGHAPANPSHRDPTTSSPSNSSCGGPPTSRNLPARFYVTIDDVNLFQKLEASLNTAKRIPVKLHVMCDGHGAEGPHPIHGQPGRVEHLPENSNQRDVPILRFAKNVLYEGAKVILGVLFNLRSPSQIDEYVAKLFTTSDLDIDVRQLQKIAKASESGKVPTAKILEMLETFLHARPDTDWLKGFLNFEDARAFRKDFLLRKVPVTYPQPADHHPDSQQYSLLCDKHYIEACGSAYHGRREKFRATMDRMRSLGV